MDLGPWIERIAWERTRGRDSDPGQPRIVTPEKPANERRESREIRNGKRWERLCPRPKPKKPARWWNEYPLMWPVLIVMLLAQCRH